MLDTVVISGEYVCCSVVFGTLVGVSVFSVMWSELLMTAAISCTSARDWSMRSGEDLVWYVSDLVWCMPVSTVL